MLDKLTHFVCGGFLGLFLSGWIFFIDAITKHPNSYLPFIIAGSVGVVFGLLASIFEERFWDKIYFLRYLY